MTVAPLLQAMQGMAGGSMRNRCLPSGMAALDDGLPEREAKGEKQASKEGSDRRGGGWQKTRLAEAGRCRSAAAALLTIGRVGRWRKRKRVRKRIDLVIWW